MATRPSPPSERALDSFQKELDRLAGRIAADEKEVVALAEFQKFEHDQNRNRHASDSLAAASARLGDTGVALQKDLIRAWRLDASRPRATWPGPRPSPRPSTSSRRSSTWSSRATTWRSRSRRLLVELRAELQTRILAELTEMHEIQKEIRETTEAQAPRVAQRSRTAELLVAGLSQKEAELGDRTEQLAMLTEETEFGIALPTALRVLSREMRIVQGWLKRGRCLAAHRHAGEAHRGRSPGLLEAMRRLPPTTPPPPGRRCRQT